MNKSDALSDHIQLWNFDKNFSVFTDGSLGFALKISPIDISCKANEEINTLKQNISHFLNSLPPDIHLQFVVDDLGNSASTLSQYKKLNTLENSDLASILNEKVLGLEEELDEGNLPKKQIFLFVRTIPEKKKSFGTFSTAIKINDMVEEKFKLQVEKLERLQNEISSGLTQLQIKSEKVDSKELSQLVYSEWNPLRYDGAGELNPYDIRESLILSDLGIYDKGFQISGMHYRIVSIKNLPDQTYSLMSEKLKNLPFQSRLYLSVHVPNQTKELEGLQTQRRITYSMVHGAKGVQDLESQAKLQDIEQLLEQMVASNEKVFNVALNIVLKSEDKNLLESQISDILIQLRELSGTEGLVESLASFKIFSDLAIPHSKCSERQKKIKTSNLSDLLPIFGYWQGHKSPSVLFKNDGGEIFHFDPFDESLSNANQLISGASGSGKSFLCNNIVLQKLKENPKVYFVDIGGSYRKLCENLGGQYIELDLNSEMSINPFDLLEGESKPSSSKIKFLVGLIEIMVKDEARPLSKLIRSEIENSLFTLYEENKEPTLSQFKDLLIANPDQEVQKIGRTLRIWCGGSPYGKFLDKKTTIDLKKDLVSFDLKGLENHPDLQTVCLYIITDLVWRQVQSEKGRQKFLIFDECWRLLKSESGLNFIEEVFRTFRKYYASAIAISQDIDDFASSKIASAILPNCSMKWLLMQGNFNKEKLKTVLGLNDNELEMVSSLSQSKGKFSDAFLLSGDRRAVLRVEPTPIEMWISTTSPKDLAKIEEYKKDNPQKSILEVLKELSQKYPNGVS